MIGTQEAGGEVNALARNRETVTIDRGSMIAITEDDAPAHRLALPVPRLKLRR